MIRQIILGLSFFSIVLLTSCGGEQKDTNVLVDSSGLKDTVLESAVKDTVSVSNSSKDFSFAEIINGLPEQEQDLECNEGYFDDYASIEKARQSMKRKACSKDMLPETIPCADTVYFAWKVTMEKYTLVNLMTTDWNPKGPIIMYHLITLDNKTGKLIDSYPEWAGSYSVGVENPNGGTSAGIEYTTGSFGTNPTLRLSTVPRESDSDVAQTYELSPEGNFVDPYAMFEAEKDLQ